MINEAILVGNVGKKETKSLKNGSGDFTMLAIATTTNYRDSNGDKQVRTTWHNINCFNKLSDIASKYVHVGDLIYIRGEINNKKIEHGERAGQYMYSVTAQDIRFLPGGKKKEATTFENAPAHVAAQKPKPKAATYDYDDLQDEIPF